MNISSCNIVQSKGWDLQISLWKHLLKISALTSCNVIVRTPDEDFSILLEAAVMYDRRVAAILNEDDSVSDEFIWKDIYDGKQYLYPRLLFIITGNYFSTFENFTSKWAVSKLEIFHCL